MVIPPADCTIILEAISQFDREKRGTAEWQGGNNHFAAYVGNWTHRRRLIRRSTEPDLNRHPEKSTVIDRLWETGRNDLQDQTIKNNLGDFACPHETKSCARAIDFNRQRQFVTMRAC